MLFHVLCGWKFLDKHLCLLIFFTVFLPAVRSLWEVHGNLSFKVVEV